MRHNTATRAHVSLANPATAMNARLTFRQWWRRVVYFFPIQLLLLHLKKNHLLLFAWVLLFAYFTESLGVKYGVP